VQGISCGTVTNISIAVSPYEGTLKDKFLNTIQSCDGRYEVPLPWKEQHALLPDNYALAVSRLAPILKHLKRNPETCLWSTTASRKSNRGKE